MHLKDVRAPKRVETLEKEMTFLEAVKNGTFTVPGDGDVSFDYIFKMLEEHDYKGWILVEAEQNPAQANPLEYAMKAREFIQMKTGI